MKPILVFRHVAHEGLGTMEPFLRQAQVQVEYCDLFGGKPVPADLSRYAMIISMGGPMNVDEIKRYPFLLEERKAIRKAIELNLPVLGICLGSQMIVRALGAEVKAGSKKEIGWFPLQFTREASRDPVFAGIEREPPMVFHWHGDTFDLPKGAVHLASSEWYAHQAFRFKDNVYAFQFHIEVTSEMILEWVQKSADELESVKAYVSARKILEETPKFSPKLEPLARSLYGRLFRGCDMINVSKEFSR